MTTVKVIRQPSVKRKDSFGILQLITCLVFVATAHSFTPVHQRVALQTSPLATKVFSSSQPDAATSPSVDSVEEATRILSEWDKIFNPESQGQKQDTEANEILTSSRDALKASVLLLSAAATEERNRDSVMGRCMLGICAPSAEDGVAALKAWVTALELPRGLLHGMDKDGVPIDLSGSVYIKYNSGGVYTFADIRKSGLGFDALWKPGDALLESYDGTYRGVYFQVELQDGEFRQYLVPLDIF
ncbi:unnamed protein product [Pseudo-nitzschia multistriata]|uniref:Uncharacterized protein n=1 Tax=Pseudo-nitzschia multistriata TaxID=183589 RepID=A0A448YUM2_9STRA|nr:unnamed protein product [Pseudo-nitzschia multistriata]